MKYLINSLILCLKLNFPKIFKIFLHFTMLNPLMGH